MERPSDGMENGNAMFQRMMECVFRNLDFADLYLDDNHSGIHRGHRGRAPEQSRARPHCPPGSTEGRGTGSRPEKGQSLCERGRVLRSHFAGGEKESITRETHVHPEVGAATHHHGTQGIFGTYQLLLMLRQELFNTGLSSHGQTSEGE